MQQQTNNANELVRAAIACHRAGRLEDALELYRRVLKLRPRDAEAMNRIGAIAQQMGDLELAVRMLDQAARILPRETRFRMALGSALHAAGQGEEALRAFQRVAELNPEDPHARCGVATILEQMHKLDDAAAAVDHALKLAPEDPLANTIRARIDRRAKRLAEARERLERITSRGGAPELLFPVHFELGRVLDRMAEYDDAFTAFSRANKLQSLTPAARAVDPKPLHQRIEEWRETISNSDLAAWAGAAPTDDPLSVFLLGFPRSGTTMTEQIIASHPDLTTLDEKPALQSTMQNMYAMFNEPQTIGDMLRNLNEAQRKELAQCYRDHVNRMLPHESEAKIIVDKFPLNIMALPFICRALPGARAIIALRDPRDVCLSCFMQEFALNSSMINFLSIPAAADFYAGVMRLWTDWREPLSSRTLDIRYEDTVTDLESQTRRLFDFLGVEWRADAMRFHEQRHRRFVSTPSYEAISTPVHTGAIGRWKNYETHIEPILQTLEPFVRAFGYE